MFSKDVNNSYDSLFDLNKDGKLNSLEYSEQLYYINQDAERWDEYRLGKERQEANESLNAIIDCASVIFIEVQSIETLYNTIEEMWREDSKDENDLRVVLSQENIESDFALLKGLLDNEIFNKQLVQIKNQTSVITERVEEIKNKHLNGLEEWLDALLEFYDSYQLIVSCFTNLNTSYYSYTEKFVTANNKCFQAYERIESLCNMNQ